MDATLLLSNGAPSDGALSVASVRAYYEKYLNFSAAGDHHSVVFHDGRVPDAWLEGLHQTERTNVHSLDVRHVGSPAAYLADHFELGREYVSVHEMLLDRFFPAEASATSVVRRAPRLDYTSYEFPRFDCSDAQRDLVLARHLAGDPIRQRALADAFYAALGRSVPYEVEIRSGAERQHVLRVKGRRPWLELCGPLVEGDLRFVPGCELFYSGSEVEGTLSCQAGINVVVLKRDGGYSDAELSTYRRLLEASQALAEAPAELEIAHGEIVAVRHGGLARNLVAGVLAEHVANRTVNEVGLGVNESAGPIVRDWAATTNEAVPGVHVGLGADPGDPSRFPVVVHFDFVETDVDVRVNGCTTFRGASGFEL